MFDRERPKKPGSGPSAQSVGTPGKSTLIEQELGPGAARQGSEMPLYVQASAADQASRAHSFASVPIHPPASATPGQEAFGAATRGTSSEVPHRAQMESVFGADFSGVEAHVGKDELGAVGARGAAQGNTVAFADASPSPALVAHELAHVEQQRKSATTSLAASRAESRRDDAAEREADGIASAIGAGAKRVNVSAAPSAALHFDRGDGADADKSATPITVRVRYRDRPDFVWRGVSHAEVLGHFVAMRGASGWEWNDSAGSTIRIYKNEKDTTGVPISHYMTRSAYEVDVDFGDAVTPDTSGTSDNSGGKDATKSATASTSSSSAKQPPSKNTSPSPSPAPSSDVATSGEWTDLPDAAETLDRLGAGTKPPSGSDKPNASSKPSDKNEKGPAPEPDQNDAESDQIADAFEAQLATLIASGEATSEGATKNSDQAGPGGTGPGGENAKAGGGDEQNIGGSTEAEGGVKSDTSEEGGRKFGDERGEYGGEGRQGDAGVRGAVALFGGLINVPDALRGAVELGILINQGDVAGVGQDLFKQGLKSGAKKFASAAMARTVLAREARVAAFKETKTVLGHLAENEAYKALSLEEKQQVARIIYWQKQREIFEGALKAAQEEQRTVGLITRATKGKASAHEVAALAKRLAKDDPEVSAIAGRVARGEATADDLVRLDQRMAYASQMEEAAKVEPVAGRLPRNHEFAGKEFPRERLPERFRSQGLRFKETGYPDFEPYAMELPSGGKSVRIEYTNSLKKDFQAANEAAGLQRTPRGYTWHHDEDLGTMMLVPADLHDAVKHTGGIAAYKHTHGVTKYGD